MTETFDVPETIRMSIDVPIDTHIGMAVECYCCGNSSEAAISRLASLVLHHAWQDLERQFPRPYWLPLAFEEIEEL